MNKDITLEDLDKIFMKFDNILKNYELDKKIGELSVDSICHLFPYEIETLKQYIQNLRFQLEEKDKVIDEIEKRCNQEISAATIQYEKHKRSDTWQYIIAHKRILEILERGKNGK